MTCGECKKCKYDENYKRYYCEESTDEVDVGYTACVYFDRKLMKLVWYRFKTKSVDDYRPLLDMKEIQMPWWCTGYAGDGSYAIIVCYLPEGTPLTAFWDDAYDIDMMLVDEITYNSRFKKPCWIE